LKKIRKAQKEIHEQQDLQIKLSGFGLVVEVIVSCEALEDKAVWLLVIPKVVVAKDVLL
jgi:hypothetical protein